MRGDLLDKIVKNKFLFLIVLNRVTSENLANIIGFVLTMMFLFVIVFSELLDFLFTLDQSE